MMAHSTVDLMCESPLALLTGDHSFCCDDERFTLPNEASPRRIESSLLMSGVGHRMGELTIVWFYLALRC